MSKIYDEICDLLEEAANWANSNVSTVSHEEFVDLAGRLYDKSPYGPAREAKMEEAAEASALRDAEEREHYFGVCPECGKCNGYINIGKGHWFYCDEHKVRWNVGSNLFSSWRYETESEQKAKYDELDFGSYRTIECVEAKKQNVGAKESIMTPRHPQWNQFRDDLCKEVARNGCDSQSLRLAISILGSDRYRFSKEAIEASLEFFRANGGFCDCEILINVGAEEVTK